MRKMRGFNKASQRLLFSSIHKRTLNRISVQNSEEVFLVGHWPDAEATQASLFNGILNAHLRGQYLGTLLQDLRHRALVEFVTSAVAGQMNAILMGQRLVDGLLLKLGRDEEADEVCDHQRHDDSVIPRHFKDHQN